MTEDQFKAEIQAYPFEISIWYTPTTPFYIQGLAIPTTDSSGRYILTYLQQSTTITLEIQPGVFANLSIQDSEVIITTVGGHEIFYADVVPNYDITNLVNSPTFQTRLTLSTIYFVNQAQQIVFDASGYNALLNNVQDIRTSDYQYLGQTGVLANIQDSVYSATGWTNGRYEGSKTSKTNYLGISPTIEGKAFQGSYFPTTIIDSQIKDQVTAGTLTYTEYLYSGEQPSPEYVAVEDAYKVPDEAPDGTPLSNIQPTDTIVPIILKPSTEQSTPIPEIDDIIQVANSLELMKIQKIEYYTNNGGYIDTQPLYKLTVERGYNRTQPQIITPVSEPDINLTKPAQIFKLEGNKVQGAQRGKVQVQISGDILHIDRLGYIVSGSR